MTTEKGIAPALALADDGGREVLRFDRVSLVGRVPKGMLDGKEVVVDLVLANDKVSRVHARLSPDDAGVLVEDLGSSNGTFVNDERVEKPRLARDGDRIRFDVLEYVFSDKRAQAKPDPARTAAAADPHGTVIRSPSPGVAQPPRMPVPPVRPAPELEDEGRRGGTMLGVRRNLPKQWLPPDAGTILLPKGKVPAQKQRQINLDKLAAETGAPTLMVFAGDSEGYPYVLECSGEINFWNIGKDRQKHDLDIILDDPSVTAFHAKLVRRGDRWKIVDMASTNHTYVNGEIFNNKFLQSKDRLRFGQVECVFLLPGVRPAPTKSVSDFLTRLFGALRFWRRR